METTEKKFRLPKDFALKWIAALRSGKYVQGDGILFAHNKYCCIGVAGSVCGIHDEQMGFSYFDNGGNAPPADSNFPSELIIGRFARELMRLNDDVKMAFTEIADWIEQNVELY